MQQQGIGRIHPAEIGQHLANVGRPHKTGRDVHIPGDLDIFQQLCEYRGAQFFGNQVEMQRQNVGSLGLPAEVAGRGYKMVDESLARVGIQVGETGSILGRLMAAAIWDIKRAS